VSAFSHESVVIGSKAFTEGYLLSELIAQKLEDDPDIKVTKRFGLGGTAILFEALQSNEIQMYPEYTGTIAEAILRDPRLKSFDLLQEALRPLNLVMSAPLGFNNNYALAVTSEVAERWHLSRVSDIKQYLSQLRFGFSNEFINRADGLRGLVNHYELSLDQKRVKSMEHSLAYEAIREGAVDVIDVYTTDAKVDKFHLRVLIDDLHYFPTYQAVILARRDFVKLHPQIWRAVQKMRGTISEHVMRHLNQGPDIEGKSFDETIAEYLGHQKKIFKTSPLANEIVLRTKEHLLLVGVALMFSMLIGIPLGILATRRAWLGQTILLVSGLLQTIPSLALLCFLVPIFGIGVRPALVALCLYGLLPVVLNTFVGLRSVDSHLIEVAKALGLSPRQRLWRIEMPLAARNILAGVKSSAIGGIGTATLAALIGAGGYGAPIVEGLAINDHRTILIGAVPAAVMALLAHAIFEGLTRVVVSRGLR
jgi:osmoprotectant transport system permease protein